MPFVTIDYQAGLPAERRRLLQEKAAQVVMETMSVPPTNVRVYTRALDPADVYIASGDTANALPIIRVEFVAGKPPEAKRALVQRLAPVVAEILGMEVSRMRTILYEQGTSDWARGDRLVADS